MGIIKTQIGKAKQLADAMMGKKAQEELMDDYEEWCIQVKKWPEEKRHKIPMKFLTGYMRKVYFKGGVGSWKQPGEQRE